MTVQREKLLIECLEVRINLSSVGFLEHELPLPVFSVRAVDLDRDGDYDIVGSNATGGTKWMENTDGDFGEPITIGDLSLGGAVYDADLDADGDIDLISVSQNGAVWWENPLGEAATNWKHHFLPPGAPHGEQGLIISDLDGDGDLDLITYQWDGLYWLQNDGTGGFGTWEALVVVDIDSEPEADIYGFDLDIDGDIDIFDAPNAIHGADADGDGDVDVFAVFSGKTLAHNDGSESVFNGVIVWFENVGGRFDVPRDIAYSGSERDYASSVTTADMNGDGDMDVISGFTRGVDWYANVDGERLFNDEPLSRDGHHIPWEITAGDLDDDGDSDIVVGVLAPLSGGQLTWYENLDGTGRLSAERKISTAKQHDFGFTSVELVDLDADGDLDILAAAPYNDAPSNAPGKLFWYETRLLGDVDDDGEVAFDDFLVLSQNFGTTVDAAWSDGDFNADDKVDFADFLLLSANFGRG